MKIKGSKFFFQMILILIMILVKDSIMFLTLTIGILIIITLLPALCLESGVSLTYLIYLIYAVKTKILVFQFIPQARVLLDMNSNIFYWLGIKNPHTIRLIIAYPGYLISEFYKINLNFGYSYYIILIFLFIYIYLVKIIKILKQRRISIGSVVILIPLILLGYVMHGRIIFSFLGLVLVIYDFLLILRYKIKKLYILGFIFTMVSSGTMIITFIYIVITKFLLRDKKKGYFKYIYIIIIFPIIYKVLGYVYFMLIRNINYFGGGISGIINMMNHGAGKLFKENDILIVLGTLGGVLYIYIARKKIKYQLKNQILLLPVTVSFFVVGMGILFGFSTGSMIIIPIIIFIGTSIDKTIRINF